MKLDLDINNVREQGYDNGSNMKGRHQGVQSRLLKLNPRAFYSTCGCHSLNLIPCDVGNSCRNATDFLELSSAFIRHFLILLRGGKLLKII
jgi:hypothetical protein